MIQCPRCMKFMKQHLLYDRMYCYCERCHYEHIIPLNAMEMEDETNVKLRGATTF